MDTMANSHDYLQSKHNIQIKEFFLISFNKIIRARFLFYVKRFDIISFIWMNIALYLKKTSRNIKNHIGRIQYNNTH